MARDPFATLPQPFGFTDDIPNRVCQDRLLAIVAPPWSDPIWACVWLGTRHFPARSDCRWCRPASA